MRHGLLLLGAAALATLPVRADDPPAAEPFSLMLGDQMFGRVYSQGSNLAKPYVWPVLAPGGVPVTRAWPMDQAGAKTKDHVHQKSAWFCHGDVIPEGVELKQRVKGVEGVDFWAESPGHGRIVCKDFHVNAEGSKAHVMTAEWQTADGAPVLAETRTLALHELGGGARLLVVRSRLRAEYCPVTFGDTKEGAFGVRVSDQLATATGQGVITNADGKTGEKECWGFVSKWCDYSGTVDGKPVGIAIFDHPQNKYPACWHVRAYGLMAANPFGRGKSGFPAMKGRTDLVKLARGEPLTLVYGILTHTGDVKSGEVAKHYEEFVKLAK